MRTIPLAPPAVVAMIVSAGLLVLGAGWFVVVAPQRHDAAAAADQVNQTQARIHQLEAAAAAAAASDTPAAKQPVIRTADLYRISKAMPSSEDQPDLLLELDQVARAAGVTVLTITPGAGSASGDYTSVPIDLSVTGDFYSLSDLLYRLRALVAVRHGALDATGRLFSVSSLALNPAGAGKTLNADLTVNAFVYGAAATTASTTTAAATSSTTTSTTSTTGATTTGASG